MSSEQRIVLEEIDAHYLTPMIMKGRVGLHPIMTILVLLTGALLLGAAGALLAVPIAAGIRVFELDAIGVASRPITEIAGLAQVRAASS